VSSVAALAQNLEADEGVLIYPEGTRFSKRKLLAARERLHDLSFGLYSRALRMKNVLPPRTAGVAALLDAAPGIDVVVFAHTGFEGARSFADFWNGALVKTSLCVRIWRIARADIPVEPARRERWLYEIWGDVDRWIGEQSPDLLRRQP